MNKQKLSKEKQEQLQKKYAEYQMIDHQVKQIKEQLEKFNQQIEELTSIHHSLLQVKEVKQGTEILIPMSSGIFVKAALQDNNQLIVNVGANVAVNKTVDETAGLITTQQTEILQYRAKLMEQLQLLVNHAGSLEKELTALASQEEKGGESS